VQPAASRLAIVIVTFNSRHDIDACLQALVDHPPAIAHQVILVDNGSTDGTPDLVRRQWPGVVLLETGGNLGFARGSNAGIRATAGELVLLLNPDCLVTAGAIDGLVAHLEERPPVAIVGPRIVGRDGHDDA